jgi:regulator of protease activity HflC (stomatin/prohibitin superfamily)
VRRNEDTSVKIRFFIRRICASQKLKMRKEAAQEWRIIMEEKVLKKNKNGMAMLMLFIALYVVAIAAIVSGAIMTETAESAKSVIAIILIVIGVVYVGLGWIFFLGLKVLKPQEALVLTLFGKYVGTIKEAGFYYVNPFCTAVNPAAETKLNQSGDVAANNKKIDLSGMSGVTLSAGGNAQMTNKKISLKVMTLNNSRQKINDCLGNPVEIGIAVMWEVTDTAKAVFNVDNYKEYLSLQCDSAVRNIVRMYPYDVAENVDTTGDGMADEGSLRGSSEVVAERIRKEIQSKVTDAGLNIIEARITYLAYAPEIAAVMLQRQQASAIIDARKMIVDGAVGMVEMALDRLSEKQVVELDEERKAAMVSNLLVVLCGNKDAQPIVNSGSLY